MTEIALVNALLNETPLEYPLHLKNGGCLHTIADAAQFIRRLPKEHDGRLHWSLAGSTLEAAGRHVGDADLLGTATRAMENALATERMLALDVSPDEVVTLHLGGEMTARSAVRRVMTEWSPQQRENSRTADEAVIFRDGEPPFLRIGEIEQLWSRPSFRDET